VKALVTGASGFTGSYLVRNLLEHGYQVRAFVRPTSNLAALEGLDVELARGVLENGEDVFRATRGVDVVFHIAALYREAGVPDRRYWEVNVEGTRNVLEAAVRGDVARVVHCSTVGVHGHIEKPPANEFAPFSPGDVYQVTKLEGEKLAWKFWQEQQLPITVVRPTGIYGPGDMRFAKLYRMVQKGTFVMLGKGKTLYHLTYVEDLVDGIRLAGEVDAAVGQPYILGGEGWTTLGEFVALIARTLGVKPPRWKLPVWPVYTAGYLCEKICIPLGIEPPIYRRRVEFFTKDRAFDISKAKKELGYRPRVSLEEGVRRTAEWYRKHGILE